MLLAAVSVFRNVINYFEEENLKYELLFVVKKTEFDEPLYCVVAKSLFHDTYTVWSCWNDGRQVLNHGYYGITTLEDAFAKLQEFVNYE